MSVSILLVGIGGYASTYVNPLLDGEREDCVIVGCADPFPNSCRRLEEIKERGIPVFADMKEFFEAGLTADLAVITTPIHLHADQIKLALSHGCHVLCEKPLCGDIRDIPSLIEARDKAGKYVGIGYQWSHSEAILNLKADILAGVYGKPKLLKTLVLWPRNFKYYKRGCGWAGKIKNEDGALILDSVANNATAHYLHNILFTLGESMDTSLEPTEVKAVLRRANNIENYDTCALEMQFANGARGLYLVTHASKELQNPIFDYEFENGHIYFEDGEKEKIIRGVMNDGTEKIYGDPFGGKCVKLWRAVEAVLDPTVKPFCGIEAATPHTNTIARVQEFGVENFAPDQIKLLEDESGVYVPGLGDALRKCYENGTMWDGNL